MESSQLIITIQVGSVFSPCVKMGGRTTAENEVPYNSEMGVAFLSPVKMLRVIIAPIYRAGNHKHLTSIPSFCFHSNPVSKVLPSAEERVETSNH